LDNLPSAVLQQCVDGYPSVEKVEDGLSVESYAEQIPAGFDASVAIAVVGNQSVCVDWQGNGARLTVIVLFVTSSSFGHLVGLHGRLLEGHGNGEIW